MKVLHVAESVWGGCGTYLNEIVPLQVQRLGADRVRCVVPAQHRAHLADVPDALVQTFDRPTRSAGWRRLAAATAAAVADWRPDVIHAHSTFAGAIVRLQSCVRRLPPIVYCPHGWAFDAVQGPAAGALTRAAERWLARRAARIVAISEAERSAGERAGIPAHRFAVVLNGIGAAPPAGRAEWHDLRLKVLFVGRLDRQKGVDVLLDAVAPLAGMASVRIVGAAVVADGAAPPAQRMSHVDFVGWLDKAGVAAQLNACDVVVMPSRWEGFGLVAVEAMRAAKPVLASAVGGLVEIVVPGVTGKLVPPGDAAALRAALAESDLASWQRMGQAGRLRFVERFTSERAERQLAQLYADVLHGQAPRPRAAAAQPARDRRTG